MRKAKHCFIVLMTACITGGITLPVFGATAQNGQATNILRLRTSVNANQTRLIFDASGGKPLQIGPASSDGISVFFGQITAKIPDKTISSPASPVKEIKFRREGGFLEVLFRSKNAKVTSKVEGSRQGRYSLVLDVTASSEKPAPAAAEKPKETPAPVETKKIETSELFGSKVSASVKNVLATGERASGKFEAEKQAVPKPKSFVPLDEQTAALFRNADEKFDSCSRNLVLCAPEIVDAYGDALRTGSKSDQAPGALYRTALAHIQMGNFSRAEKLFRQVVSEWPDHPAACRAWIGIGNVFDKKQGYLEAMEAFRWALRIAVDKDDKAAASFELGKELLTLGAAKDALEMLNQSISLDPDYYVKKPDVYRLIGEAEFSQGMWDKSKEHLLRYVNYQESAPDQDMVLAKLAEVYLNQGDAYMANRMYGFLQKYYTDSEGDLISRIRKAELLEKADRPGATRIYAELCEKDLAPALRRIVQYKLSSLYLKRGDLEQSLELVDGILKDKDALASTEIIALRERVLSEMVGKYYADKNYIPAVQLYEKYRALFDTMQPADMWENIAECYAGLKFYSNSLEIYDRLIAKGQRKGDDVQLKCALYAIRSGDQDRSSQYCRFVSDASDLKKSEIQGHIFYRDRKYADAVRCFAKVLQKGKELENADPDSLHYYGLSLYETRKCDEAISVFQKCLQRLKKDDAEMRRQTLVSLARCYAETKQYQTAIETMESALSEREGQSNELLYELSNFYLAAGQAEKATENLNQIVGAQNPFWTAVAQQQLNSIQMAQPNPIR